VDGTIVIDGRENLTLRGESATRRFIMYTNLTGQEAYPHTFDGDPASHQNDSQGWEYDALGSGLRTWRGSDGQSFRRHWLLLGSCEGITLQHIHVTGPNTARVAEAPDYGSPDNGTETWEDREAEHAFAIGSSTKPTMSRIRLYDCHAVNTHGDGFHINVTHAANAQITIDQCSSFTAGRHAMALVGVRGLVVRNFRGMYPYSAVCDIEPNGAADGVRDVLLTGCSGDCYRIPLLVQNGTAGAVNRDISIEDYAVLGWGYHETTWYPVVQAVTNTEPPVGTLALRNIDMAGGVEWDSNGDCLISVADWPSVIVEGCAMDFKVLRASASGVKLDNVAARSLSGNSFGPNCGLGELVET
jgi:hypothetical protein